MQMISKISALSGFPNTFCNLLEILSDEAGVLHRIFQVLAENRVGSSGGIICL